MWLARDSRETGDGSYDYGIFKTRPKLDRDGYWYGEGVATDLCSKAFGQVVGALLEPGEYIKLKEVKFVLVGPPLKPGGKKR